VNERPTVLVLGAGSNVSQGILKALALASLRCRVVAACVTPDAAGLYLADRAYVSPYADDPGFSAWVIDVCRREGVRAVLSGVEPVLAALAEAAEEIRASAGAVCIVSPPEVLRVGQDKLVSCRWLAERGFPHPRFAHAAERDALEALVAQCGYPLIAKPRHGRSAEGLEVIADASALERIADRDDLVVQELLGDAAGEYTVGCFCDADGVLRGSIAMHRQLSAGTTVRAEVGTFDEAREVSERVVGALRPVGPCNVQLRLSGRRAVPFELNVRFSGTTPMCARLGFNDVEAAVRHFALGEPAVDLAAARDGVVLRYWNEVYVPREAVESLSRGEALDGHPGSVEDWGA
jgi:carbamoyl-phosphate synthase large subunit